MNGLQKAILKTLSYADVFDYPLSPKELYRFLIGYKVGKIELKKIINHQPLAIDHQDSFCFLKGRKEIVALRKKRERWSQGKLKIAQRVAKYFKIIPFIKMVAVTGNLAMNNSDESDDIDLLIVTGKDRLWLTRFLTVFLVELVANRRHPGDQEVKDKICLNMFLDEDHLLTPKKDQNLFVAHEICQLKPLWERNDTYQKFLKVNQWSQKFLPNWKF